MRLLLLLIIVCALSSLAIAKQADQIQKPKLFDGIWTNVADSFTGTNLLFHIGGVGATAVLANSGYDAQVHGTFKHRRHYESWPGAVIGSGLVAVGTGVWLYSNGVKNQDNESIGAAFAIAQATMITLAYVSVLKSSTSRPHPTNSSHLTSYQQSNEYELSFMRGIMSYGWPSGHASHTAAVTSALAHYYPSKMWLKWMGFGLTGYMIYTVSSFYQGQMHWFSDGVAGAMMGYAIGSSVGKNFRRRIDGQPVESAKFNWIPIIDRQYIGLVATLEHDWL